MSIFNTLMKRNEQTKPTGKMSAAIDKWTALYENREFFEKGVKSLNLAAGVCSELARLATIEFKSEISGSDRAVYLNEQYQEVISKARVFLEYACAKGGVILKPYINADRISVSIIQADCFLPTEFSSEGRIIGAVFYDKIKRNGRFYTRVEEHSMRDDGYYILNTAYESRDKNNLGKQIPLGDVYEWRDIEKFCKIDNIKKPLFAYLKMPMANNIDKESCLGVSVFSGAVELIGDAYKQYSNLLWEFESGKRALFVDECAIRRDNEGNIAFPEKRLYRLLSTGDDTLFEDWSPEMREEHILKGLDRILRNIEFNCGLAYGTLSDCQSTDKTAEEVRASKQRSYATVCDIQNSMKSALCDLADAMNVYCDIYSLAPEGSYQMSFDFDDSIICDRTAEYSERMSLLEKGVIAPWEMRAWYFEETENTARKRIEGNNYV